MDKTSELLPCPFCGGDPKLRHIGNDRTAERKLEVKCSGCRMQLTHATRLHGFDWLEGLILRDWNRRALTQSAAVEGEPFSHACRFTANYPWELTPDGKRHCEKCVALYATAPPAQRPSGVDEDTLIALVAGPYHYHHKMDEAAEREGKAFDRCRELTIQNIRAWCATQRALAAALSTQDKQQSGGSSE